LRAGRHYYGAMVEAGLGYTTYEHMADRLAEAADLIMRQERDDDGGPLQPYDYEVHENPYPLYARLRNAAPLYRNEELDFWALSRHVTAAFREPARFSNANGVSLDPSAWGPHAHKTMSFLAPPAFGAARRNRTPGQVRPRAARLLRR